MARCDPERRASSDQSPSPAPREREGPSPQGWEGEGDFPRAVSRAEVAPSLQPLPRWGSGGLGGALAGRRIGLLGGSFNPAHGGHLHISRLALRHLDLDAVWWLVSPQNPLKPVAGMAPFAERLRQATGVAAADRRIRVSDIEAGLGTTYTADTLKALRRRFPRARFVWLMGGDNLRQFPYWRRWQDIFGTMPIAVFDRPSASLKALAGPAAQRFAGARVPVAAARLLAAMRPPAWVFFHTKLDPCSATRIRAERLSMENTTDVTLSSPAIPVASPGTPAGAPAGAIVRSAPRRRQTLSAAELLRRIVDTLEDGKADEVVTIDLAGKTTIADYMVVASGRSSRQVAALTEHLAAILPKRTAIEGKSQGDWVLIDAGDVIVHIFRPEVRAYYNLEKMWGEALPEFDDAAAEAVLQ